MKKIIFTFSLLALGQTASAAMMICGQGGMAVFNPRSVSECFHTTNTCQTQDLLSRGYLRSPNGKCPEKARELQACGMGGGLMVNPHNPQEVLQSLSTCETHALKQMGYVHAR